jgi:hypothetical protein
MLINATKFSTKFCYRALVLLPLHVFTCQPRCRKLKTTKFHCPSITQDYSLHEGIWRSRGVTLILALHIRWICAFKLRCQPLWVPKNNLWCPFSSRLGGPEKRSQHFWEDKDLLLEILTIPLSYGLSLYRQRYFAAVHKKAKTLSEYMFFRILSLILEPKCALTLQTDICTRVRFFSVVWSTTIFLPSVSSSRFWPKKKSSGLDK